MTAFEYSGTDQRFNKAFNQAMSEQSSLIMKKILDIYKGFEGLKVLADVGGGVGILESRRILHGWSDEYCLNLLENFWEALPDKGKVIIIESVLPDTTENVVFITQILLEQNFDTLAINSCFSSCSY
ncbi:caffeic acid 3-O-methyltransferase-like [Ricinus communis]|uniref:caffeic acid 3-O-methyltransferase-like n=1 Tax=Ricinus communis TaxID=3988 RepID=UPI0007727B79|nr:caffeic acid 3-O-methyltransferase-like [Ricinus communis]